MVWFFWTGLIINLWGGVPPLRWGHPLMSKRHQHHLKASQRKNSLQRSRRFLTWDKLRQSSWANGVRQQKSQSQGTRIHTLMRKYIYITSLAITFCLGEKSNAGYYRYPLEGYHKACADGSTTDVSILTGYGGMYLSGSGNPMNAFPMNTFAGNWSPLLGASSLCWTRPMSEGTQRSLINSYKKYCINHQNNYCF